MMGNPITWPKNVFAMWPEKPKGLPPRYRTWGACKLAEEMLARWQFTFSPSVVASHYGHVPRFVADPSTLAEMGMVAVAPAASVPAASPRGDQDMGLDFFRRGLSLSMKGLELLEQRVEQAEQLGEEVPLEVIKMMTDVGGKLAMAAASIQSRGGKLGQKAKDDPFRQAAGAKDVGPKVGGHRARVIEGDWKTVTDKGQADRDAFEARAVREGRPGLMEMTGGGDAESDE